MCGRFALKDYRGVQDLFRSLNVVVPEMEPRFNIAPGSFIPGLTADMNFRTDIHWGMTPHWAKEGSLLINARAETIREKSSFKKHIGQHRLILPASGFYEWKQQNGKIPYYFHAADGNVLAMAGIYRINNDGVFQCAVITTNAGSVMSAVHDRQPVLLKKDSMKDWLLSEDNSVIDGLMKPQDGLEMYRVSTFVNNSRNEGSECIEPFSGEADPSLL